MTGAEPKIDAPCQLQVRPEHLAIGVVERGRAVTRAIELENTGPASCAIEALETVGDLGPLDHAPALPIALPPGQTLLLRLTLHPGKSAGALILRYAGMERWIELSSALSRASPLLVPRQLDFGRAAAKESCAGPRTATLYNTDSRPLRVEAIEKTGPEAFQLSHQAPATLAPGEALSFELRFCPPAPGAIYEGLVELRWSSAEARGLLALPLRGQAQ